MSASVAQPALLATLEPVKRPQRQSGRRLRPVPAEQPTVWYEPPRLTVERAVQQALEALTVAGLRQHVSRIVVWPADQHPRCLATVALLRIGTYPNEVHAALLALPGVVGSHCGEASVSVYRQVTP